MLMYDMKLQYLKYVLFKQIVLMIFSTQESKGTQK